MLPYINRSSFSKPASEYMKQSSGLYFMIREKYSDSNQNAPLSSILKSLVEYRKQQSPELYFISKKMDKVSNPKVPTREDCPLDSTQIGKATWSFLHTLAAYYPDHPTPEQEEDVQNFFETLSRLYPCSYCAKDFQRELKASPPATKSQEELTQWLCRVHNNVNKKLGKPFFDCSRVNERWRDGWKDGSCD